MDDRTTTTPAQTSSTQSTTTPTSGGAMGSPSGLRPGGGTANVQLRQSLRGMDYTEQATQLKPADQGAGVQMMRRSGAVQRAPAQGPRVMTRRRRSCSGAPCSGSRRRRSPRP